MEEVLGLLEALIAIPTFLLGVLEAGCHTGAAVVELLDLCAAMFPAQVSLQDGHAHLPGSAPVAASTLLALQSEPSVTAIAQQNALQEGAGGSALCLCRLGCQSPLQSRPKEKGCLSHSCLIRRTMALTHRALQMPGLRVTQA